MSVLKLNMNKDQGGAEDLMQQALVVSDGDSDEDESGPPIDGMSYLRKVVKERKNIPGTVTAEIDPGKIKETSIVSFFTGGTRSKPEVPKQFCPSTSWQNQQVSEFSDVRVKLERHTALLKSTGEPISSLKLPSKENEMLWCVFCYGSEIWKRIESLRQENDQSEMHRETEFIKSAEQEQTINQILEENKEGTPPHLRVLLSMSVHVVERVLEYQVGWLEATGWLPEYGAWLYALLTRLEKPIHPDIGSVLRDLALVCCNQRAELIRKRIESQQRQKPAEMKSTEKPVEGELNDTEFLEDKDIAAFNLFICLVGKYYSQVDLAD